MSEKLQKTQGELSERLETIEEMKSTIAKHKDKAEKGELDYLCYWLDNLSFVFEAFWSFVDRVLYKPSL